MYEPLCELSVDPDKSYNQKNVHKLYTPLGHIGQGSILPYVH